MLFVSLSMKLGFSFLRKINLLKITYLVKSVFEDDYFVLPTSIATNPLTKVLQVMANMFVIF